jgi:chromatin assembly factor 1 subunit A
VKNKVGRPKKEKMESESHNRSRSMMANFLGNFVKPKNHQRSHGTQKRSDVPSPKRSDFEKAFKPFLLKKDAVLALENGFASRKKSQRSRSGTDPKHAIVVESVDNQTTIDPLQVQVVDDRLDDVNLDNMSNEGPALGFCSNFSSY